MLAHDATMPAIREHLSGMALQYDEFADGAEAGYQSPE
jgi:hypothetical protein